MILKTVNRKYIVFVAAWLIIFILCSVLSGVTSAAQPVDSDEPKQSSSDKNADSTDADSTAEPDPSPEADPEPDKPDEPPLPYDPDNAAYTIVLDAGHGWYDNGCEIPGRTDIYEKNITLAVTKKIQSSLEAMGFTVIMIREDDTDEGCVEALEQGVYKSIRRIRYANAQGADYYVSIHVDSYSANPSVSGTRIYYRDKLEESAQLADRIATVVSDQLHTDKPSLKNDVAYNVIEYAYMPSVLIEMGFATNADDAANMLDPEWQENFARSVALGVNAHINPSGGE